MQIFVLKFRKNSINLLSILNQIRWGCIDGHKRRIEYEKYEIWRQFNAVWHGTNTKLKGGENIFLWRHGVGDWGEGVNKRPDNYNTEGWKFHFTLRSNILLSSCWDAFLLDLWKLEIEIHMRGSSQSAPEPSLSLGKHQIINLKNSDHP